VIDNPNAEKPVFSLGRRKELAPAVDVQVDRPEPAPPRTNFEGQRNRLLRRPKLDGRQYCGLDPKTQAQCEARWRLCDSAQRAKHAEHGLTNWFR
jgi:hypothetical protein